MFSFPVLQLNSMRLTCHGTMKLEQVPYGVRLQLPTQLRLTLTVYSVGFSGFKKPTPSISTDPRCSSTSAHELVRSPSSIRNPTT